VVGEKKNKEKKKKRNPMSENCKVVSARSKAEKKRKRKGTRERVVVAQTII